MRKKFVFLFLALLVTVGLPLSIWQPWAALPVFTAVEDIPVTLNSLEDSLKRNGFESMGETPYRKLGNLVVRTFDDGGLTLYRPFSTNQGEKYIEKVAQIGFAYQKMFKETVLVAVNHNGSYSADLASGSGTGGKTPLPDEDYSEIRLAKPEDEQLLDIGFERTESDGWFEYQLKEGENNYPVLVSVKNGIFQAIITPHDVNALIGKDVMILRVEEKKDILGDKIKEVILRSGNREIRVELKFGGVYYAGFRYIAEPSFEELGIESLTEKVEESGFVIAGENDSELIRSLTSLAETPIATLEARMRPGVYPS